MQDWVAVQLPGGLRARGLGRSRTEQDGAGRVLSICHHKLET